MVGIGSWIAQKGNSQLNLKVCFGRCALSLSLPIRGAVKWRGLTVLVDLPWEPK